MWARKLLAHSELVNNKQLSSIRRHFVPKLSEENSLAMIMPAVSQHLWNEFKHGGSRTESRTNEQGI